MTGPSNIVHGVKEFFLHYFGPDTLLGGIFHPVVDEIYSYEKTHGKEELDKALQAGKAAYEAARMAGDKVGSAILSGVAAFFLSEAKDIKTISTQAATAALAGAVK